MVGELPVYKIVILGDGGVGKTAFTIQVCMSAAHVLLSLLASRSNHSTRYQLVSNTFITMYDPTIEDTYRKQMIIDGRPCVVEILDTAGQEEYTALRDQWIRDGEGFIVMFSITSRSSMSRVQRLYQQIQQVRDQQTEDPQSPAASHIAHGPASLVTCLVGNKTDRTSDREVTTQEGFSLAKELNCSFFECSSYEYDQVEAPVVEVVRKLERQKANVEKAKAIKEAIVAMEAEIQPVPKPPRFFASLFRNFRAPPPQPVSTIQLSQQILLSQTMTQAVRYNKATTVKRLLALGADPNGIAGVDGSPLSTAAALGYRKMVTLLLSHRAAINARDVRGATALVLAAAEGHLTVVKLLSEEGALIDAPSSIHGTALIAATFRGHAKIVNFLVLKGANVNARGSQYGTALHTAAVVGKEDLVKILLDAGADATARDDDDRSPLHLASSLGHAGVVQLLLLRGSTGIINEVHGKYGSALDAAYANSHFTVVKVLLQFGAIESPGASWAPAFEAPKLSKQAGTVSGDGQTVNNTLSSVESSSDMRPGAVFPSNIPPPLSAGGVPEQHHGQCLGDISRPTHRNHFKIAIVCALSLEADAVEAVFDRCWEEDGERYGRAAGDTNAYTTGMIGRHHVVLVHMPSIGKGAASSVASNVRNSFKGIELALVVGVCGAAPQTPDHQEIVLGDVVISEALVQYDFGRRLPYRFVRKDSLLDNLGRPNPVIRSLLAKLRGRRSRIQLEDKLAGHLTTLQERMTDDHITYPGFEGDKLFQSTYLHQHHHTACVICSARMTDNGSPICQDALQSTCDELGCDNQMTLARSRHIVASREQKRITPRVHFGLIASGDSVIKSGLDRDALAARDGVIGFEMEGAGVWDNLPCVVIKGVCDYADSHKNKRWQNYAAATAAACMKAFLEEWITDEVSHDTRVNSWLAISQLNFVSRFRHPNLKAVASWEGLRDVYTHQVCRGGIPKPAFGDVVTHGLAAFPHIYTSFTGLGKVESIGAMIKSRPTFDEYWEEKRINPEDIEDMPMYLTASYSTGLHCEGSFKSFEVAQTPRKWLRVHATQEWHDIYRPEATDDLQRFYDYYAKGIQNGWETETPRVRLSLLGYDSSPAKTVVERPEEQWPPARQHIRRYYLDSATQSLTMAQPSATANALHDGHSLTASSDCTLFFDKYTELCGHPFVKLHMSCNSKDDFDVAVQIRKISASGEPLVSLNWTLKPEPQPNVPDVNVAKHLGQQGMLRASHHVSLCARNSEDQVPAYDHRSRQPITPGKIVPLLIPIWPVGMVFEVGEGLMLWIYLWS
ncbi:hypothetical protein BBP40_008469 [Aspergillus hancockii]|nr:hypothetical protein BBP40_008469 [Aspergillus hancockii]